ncbi:MAG: GNAT family N-acetyltransferase, partial [Nitriliruptorales bacterium]|nr:GNAT family N-acetyltransferase [Nitriliruptorales bacterium]
HPDHAALEVRTALWDAAEARARERHADHPRPRIRHASNATDEEEGAGLAARGMEVVRHFWQMRRTLDGPVAAGAPPAGVTLAPPRDEDLRDAHQILQTSFAEHFGHEDEPWDDWLARVTASTTTDLDLWLLARVDGEPVGALVAHDFGDRGWVSELGVLEEFRGRGIGEALLRRSFATLAGRGLPRVLLSVDAQNETGATALYERAGMSVVRRWTLWEREL